MTAPHGVRGEVRINIETDFPERFAPREVFSARFPEGSGKGLLRLEVESARPHKQAMLVKFAGVDTRDAAEALRGAEIVIPREEVRPLPDGSWYIFELEGLEVYTEDGTRLGVLTEVLQGAGNDVYVVQGEREILLPAIKQVVLDVDRDARRMKVHLLDGL